MACVVAFLRARPEEDSVEKRDRCWVVVGVAILSLAELYAFAELG